LHNISVGLRGRGLINTLILPALAIACAGLATPASAAEYYASFTGTSGKIANASMWFTTTDTLNALGGYDIVSAHGSVGTDRITGLVANPN
jgi:hypothetical protein